MSKEKKNEINTAYYHRHKERILSKQRQWYAENKEVTKPCEDCPFKATYADVPPGNPRPRGLYLRDIIKRVQDEEQLPSPQPKAEKALESLKKALLDACDTVEHDAQGYREAYGGLPSLRTAVIRRIIKENT